MTRRSAVPSILLAALTAVVSVAPSTAHAHDAGAWGGLFRSRDMGLSWFQANQGRLVSGALAIDVNPLQPTALLLGTDTGLLATSNAGLDWTEVVPDVFARRPVLAVAFAADGHGGLAATDRDLLRSGDDDAWQRLPLPPDAKPVRALARGQGTSQIYLLGWRGTFRSDDWGSQWERIDAGLPGASPSGLVVLPDTLLIAVSGNVWASSDEGRSWRPANSGLPPDAVQALSLDPASSTTVWAGGADQVFRSQDRGTTWRKTGQPLPDAGTEIRGIAADASGASVLISTHRGVYTSTNGGATWSLVGSNLPGHLEAGPLVQHPAEPTTLYVGFSLIPYAEHWALAASGRGAGSLSELELFGGGAFLLLLGLGSGAALRWLARFRRSGTPSAGPIAA